MWADNETSTDLLGFGVHKDLILRLVTNPNLLPLTVGVFGDWGGGKSSVMRMLQAELEGNGHKDVACLYFNGWVFEGYDDAKAALLSAILMQLGEHKRFLPENRDRIVKLLKRVNVMRSLKEGFNRLVVPTIGGALAAAVAAGIIDQTAAAGIGGALAVVTGRNLSDPSGKKGDAEEKPVDWQALVNADDSAPGPLDIQSFRRDFEKLLADTNLTSVVVLIDDLDRCSPERLIENLEAIKLFLAVPGTAFVIAADERIVRYAIETRYKAKQVQSEQSTKGDDYDLVTEYLEKLIQIPYHLPRLSPSEIESYMTMLLCQLGLTEKGAFDKVRTHCADARKGNVYKTFGISHVQAALNNKVPEQLVTQLQWSGEIAPIITENLKGNPRQVKRFLNALMLRRQLAEVAGLTSIKDDVLVKLMVLEYSRPKLFEQVYHWQAASKVGEAAPLAALEDSARVHTVSADGATEGEGTQPGTEALPSGASELWKEQFAQQWLRTGPSLKGLDLGYYFWVARDRLTGSITGVSALPPAVRAVLDGLLSESEHYQAAEYAKKLNEEELANLLYRLGQYVQSRTNEDSPGNALLTLVEAGVDSAAETLVDAVAQIPRGNVGTHVPYWLTRLVRLAPATKPRVLGILGAWSKEPTGIGLVAQDALDDIRKDAK